MGTSASRPGNVSIIHSNRDIHSVVNTLVRVNNPPNGWGAKVFAYFALFSRNYRVFRRKWGYSSIAR